jgi:hypothetical protein
VAPNYTYPEQTPIWARWVLASGYSLPLSHTAAIPSQSSVAAQALEKTSAHVKAVYMRGTIGLQDPAFRHVLATHGRRAHRVVGLEQYECWTYKIYYE